MNGKRYAVILACSLDETAAPAEGPTVDHHRGAAATPRPAFCARQVSRRRPNGAPAMRGTQGARFPVASVPIGAGLRLRPSTIGRLAVLIDPGLAAAFRIRGRRAVKTRTGPGASPAMATPGRALSQKALVGISPTFGNAGLRHRPKAEATSSAIALARSGSGRHLGRMPATEREQKPGGRRAAEAR
jgi:hypothetical protein